MAIIRQLHKEGYTMDELAIALKIPRSSLYARMKRGKILDIQHADHIETTIINTFHFCPPSHPEMVEKLNMTTSSNEIRVF